VEAVERRDDDDPGATLLADGRRQRFR